jgi:hypothetical protein
VISRDGLDDRISALERQRDRADARARYRLSALREAAKFAREREAACKRQVERYEREKPDDPYWARSERCAASEAKHIAEKLEELHKEAERQGRRFANHPADQEREG